MNEIKGIDISVWQKGINYKALSDAGVKFAILRASYSKSKDTQLDNHVKGCTKQGIDVGYYVYSLARTTEEARQEAKACIDIIKKYGGKYMYDKYNWRFNDEVVKVFDEHVKKSVPLYQLFHKDILDMSVYFVQNNIKKLF